MKCECGCGNDTPLAKINRKERGWVKGEPMRFYPGHHHIKHAINYEIDPNTGCWNWLLYKMPNGYGVITRGHRPLLAHRYYYSQKYGEIPEGKDLDHLCRNRGCVNPDHLEVVDRITNARRGAKTKIDQQIANEIRSLKGIKSHKEISELYQISSTRIYDIWEGKAWNE